MEAQHADEQPLVVQMKDFGREAHFDNLCLGSLDNLAAFNTLNIAHFTAGAHSDESQSAG
eukprot:6207575-Pleurochrysis_carterae.AAC.1